MSNRLNIFTPEGLPMVTTRDHDLLKSSLVADACLFLSTSYLADVHDDSSAGPGNYKTGNEFELLSESPSRRGEAPASTWHTYSCNIAFSASLLLM